jgi:hypothetical protein
VLLLLLDDLPRRAAGGSRRLRLHRLRDCCRRDCSQRRRGRGRWLLSRLGRGRGRRDWRRADVDLRRPRRNGDGSGPLGGRIWIRLSRRA